MSVINAVPLLAAAGGDYTISRSVRLRSSASAYFSRTPASAGNRKTWTWSGWVKRGSLGGILTLFSSGSGSAIDTNWLGFVSSDSLAYSIQDGTYYLATTQVFRDPSAWYHIVLATDTTQATASNRAKMYVNGVQVTAFSTATYATQNLDQVIGAANLTTVGAKYRTAVQDYFDGYLTEINFIDGQALTPSSFGETDTITGVWKPKKYAGTYGTNGFYLNFSDNSNNTAATIGKDYSGNGNNWTPNNISVTSGATYDSMLDVPTPYADGGNGRGNYAVLNPLDKAASASVLNGNLRVTSGSATALGSRGTFQIPTTGKWYYEGVVVNSPSGSTPIEFGCATDSASLTALQATGSYGIYVSSAISYMNNGTASGSLGSLTAGDIIQFAGDCDNGRIWIGKNNVYWDASSGTTGNPSSNSNPTLSVSPASMFPLFLAYNNSLDANFGQRPFTYTPPSGFKALNTQNLPDSTIKAGNKYMDVAIQTGNTTGRTVSGLAFQPDLVWVKNRAGSTNRRWGVIDSVRGVNKTLTTQYTDAEVTSQTDLLTAFNSDGFTIGADANLYGWNGFVESYVHFVWKAGNGSSSNTSGSITSTVSVNATAGFSVVTYSGNGAAGATVGHGLGVAPSMIIVKCRTAGTNSWTAWQVYHSSLTSPATSFLRLNETSAVYTGYAAAWNSTNPTSSVFSVSYSGGAGVNGSGDTFVAYCFSAVAGYSAFGSYTGNGSSDGPFVFCGFRPRWIMVKSSTSVTDWKLLDTSRNPYNSTNSLLGANISAAEDTNTAYDFDILSNGFKPRNTFGYANTNGATYIYAAFAENPFKNSLAR